MVNVVSYAKEEQYCAAVERIDRILIDRMVIMDTLAVAAHFCLIMGISEGVKPPEA